MAKWPVACMGCGKTENLDRMEYTSNHHGTFAGSFNHLVYRISSFGNHRYHVMNREVTSYLCPECRRKAWRRHYISLTITIAAIIAAWVGFFMALISEDLEASVVLFVIGLAILVFFVPEMLYFIWRRRNPATFYHKVRYRPNSGTFHFIFKSPEYAKIFRKENPTAVVKVGMTSNFFPIALRTANSSENFQSF